MGRVGLRGLDVDEAYLQRGGTAHLYVGVGGGSGGSDHLGQ